MRWPFTPYGTGTMLAFAVPLLALAEVLRRTAPGAWWLLPLPLAGFVLSFFRDPERSAPGGEDDLVSPADGLVTDVAEVDDSQLGGPATRIGVFLSVLDVHVNRAPCGGEVLAVHQRAGAYHDARDPRAVEGNRAATIVLRRADGRRLAVRQITGLIARRIVCPVEVGDHLGRGERYGMIRFGSRTELVVPTAELDAVLVAPGTRVKGGETLLARLRPAGGAAPAATGATGATRQRSEPAGARVGPEPRPS